MTEVSSKMAKICNINFWIENAHPHPPPLELFRKFIRFGRGKRPLQGRIGFESMDWIHILSRFDGARIKSPQWVTSADSKLGGRWVRNPGDSGDTQDTLHCC